MKNYIYIIAPALGWLAAQAIKFILANRKDGINWGDFLQSGGFPSSHSAFMVALTTVVGINYGIKSVTFAVVAAVTAIILYDSFGVRQTTGNQTKAIFELAERSKIRLRSKIHISEGHTVMEVFSGCLLGILVGVILNWLI